MECAIVLAKRGIECVHLVEAESEIGGIMRWIPRLPGLGEWGRFLSNRKIQIEKLENLEVALNTSLDSDAIRDYGADIVILATGARWSSVGLSPVTHEPLEGADAALDYVFTPEQLMVGGQRPPAGTRVVVYDCEGYFMGAGLAELLNSEGYPVDIVTAYGQVAGQCDITAEGFGMRSRLHAAGVGFHRNVALSRVAEGRIDGHGEFGEPFSFETGAVVLVTHRFPKNRLYRTLTEDRAALEAHGITGLYQTGDCVSPRMLADTVFDGHRLAREIDSGHPERPLAYRHESAHG